MKRSRADSAGGQKKRSSRPRCCATSCRRGSLWGQERRRDAQVFAVLEEVDEGSLAVLDAVGVFSHVSESPNVAEPETVVLLSRSDSSRALSRHCVLRLDASRNRSQYIHCCRIWGI